MRLFYRKYGEGPPLVILHGLFGSSDNWTTIAKILANDFTVIIPDLRNHGRSPHSDLHDYDSMSMDLFELISELKIERFLLAGHSMGGKTAVNFAIKWPEMLSGLLVADISPFRVEDADRTEYRHHEKILRAMLYMDLSKINSREQAGDELKKYDLPEKTIGFILKNLHRLPGNRFEWKLNAQSLYDNMENILKGIGRSGIYSLQVTGFPVIFLKGSESNYLPEDDYQDIKKIFPAAEFITIKNAGHWLHADNPEEVIKNIRKLSD